MDGAPSRARDVSARRTWMAAVRERDATDHRDPSAGGLAGVGRSRPDPPHRAPCSTPAHASPRVTADASRRSTPRPPALGALQERAPLGRTRRQVVRREAVGPRRRSSEDVGDRCLVHADRGELAREITRISARLEAETSGRDGARQLDDDRGPTLAHAERCRASARSSRRRDPLRARGDAARGVRRRPPLRAPR